jgi:hypothetical protein
VTLQAVLGEDRGHLLLKIHGSSVHAGAQAKQSRRNQERSHQSDGGGGRHGLRFGQWEAEGGWKHRLPGASTCLAAALPGVTKGRGEEGVYFDILIYLDLP